WLSNGDGTFRIVPYAPNSTYATNPSRIRIGDFNGDGKADILDPVDGQTYAYVWLSNGDGTFRVTQYTPWPGYGVSSSRVQIADVNGDGRADVIDPIDGASVINTWISRGDGTFYATTWTPPTGTGVSISSHGLRVGDFNGDGKDDY